MKPRHQSRQAALQYLFSREPLLSISTIPAQVPAPQDLAALWGHFQIPEPSREFASELVYRTLANLKAVDTAIQSKLMNWKWERVSAVDRNILRLGCTELLHFPQTPASVILDESIELAKTFGTAESGAFINGLLDALRQQYRLEEPEHS